MVTDFRSINGLGNNIANPTWGEADIPLLRIAGPFYEDGFNAPRITGANGLLPNPRTISNIVARQSESVPNDLHASDWLWQWGQFMDHDLDLNEGSQITSPPEDFLPILVPQDDPTDPFVQNGVQFLPFIRVEAVQGTGTAPSNPRQQENLITAFIDASNVYGSDTTTATNLRTNDGTGKLRTSFASNGETLLPIENGQYIAGDVRAAEQTGLTAVHTLFVREHNRLTDALKQRLDVGDTDLTDAFNNSGLSEGDFIYEAARYVVGAELQAVTYNEFLPLLVGRSFIPMAGVLGGGFGISSFEGYDPTVNPGITHEFANAAYRIGHTMLPNELKRVDNNGNEESISLAASFFNPAETVRGIDTLYKGLSAQKAQAIDNLVNDAVRNFLFPAAGGGLDLAAVNIARGRDVGLPTYNETRVALGLARAEDFYDISSDPAVAQKLEDAYGAGNVDNVDLWVGGLAEDKVNGGLSGEVFNLLISDQFQRLRDGDRFFYQNDGVQDALKVFAPDFQDHDQLSELIMQNSSVIDLQKNAFKVFDHVIEGTNRRNTLYGTRGNDEVHGLAGNDKIYAEQGDDDVYGGRGNDTIKGNAGMDTLFGEEGRDRLYGGRNIDTLDGGEDGDFYFWETGDGRDVYADSGVQGTDIIVSHSYHFDGLKTYFDAAQTGIEVIKASGNDYLNIRGDKTLGEYWDFSDVKLVKASIQGRGGDDTIIGSQQANTLEGGKGEDILEGQGGNDVIFGGRDNDILLGGAGKDVMIGGRGNDRLNGGIGNDEMTGAQGIDTFEFVGNFGKDRITDFRLTGSQADLIDLTAFNLGLSEVASLTRNQGWNALIDLRSVGGGRIILEGVDASDLTAEHFVL
ncbi:MAG: peroxidase family protein [Cyanobacteria bacterium P01_B01_bin.77]